MSEQLTNIQKKLNDCWDYDSHEGSFNLLGKEINVFTRMARDENDYGGEKSAFIDDTYWTGWYPEDLGNDLKEVMTDIVNELFTNNSIEFKVTGELLNTSDSSQEILENLKKFLQDRIEYDLNSKLLNISISKNNQSYTAIFSGKSYAVKEILMNHNNEIYGDNETFGDGHIECLNDEIKTFFNEAFSYSINFY